ncbi:hypothetical protein [Mesorhizobium sp.]|nr:hypothetical protein [Mesorhizobium sp.]
MIAKVRIGLILPHTCSPVIDCTGRRSYELQRDRRQGLLSGSCEADLYG